MGVYFFDSHCMLSQIRLSSVCLSSATFVCPTQPVEILGNVSTPFCTLAIRIPHMVK